MYGIKYVFKINKNYISVNVYFFGSKKLWIKLK